MSYQVLARKWRPQRFDDVVGQQAVTRTLRNAITSGRIGQAFVFAGPRGCGKTTTARILARALNCVQGPTPDPCGTCEACVEIAQGRDLDVLEIDAASHTGIDNIREVVIAGLSIAPARDRYKVFIIDEVHQLSSASFNALLKSIEEPPAHVVFMMATTELHKIPDTILSRSQVFEFRTISTAAITAQLKTIAAAEQIEVSDAALALIARFAEGSMRDAQSAFDQVIAFANSQISVDDVATVLGVVGRDLVFDLIEAVLDEDGPRAFALADQATERGHDLKLVCRELARVVRNVMLLSVDPERAGDGELDDADRERLATLSRRFSREDVMRAFDLLARAEQDIRSAAHPRYHFEMMLLRWMHVRKLLPLTELMEQLRGEALAPTPAPSRPSSPPRGMPAQRLEERRTTVPAPPRAIRPARTPQSWSVARPGPLPVAAPSPTEGPVGGAALKDALLREIRAGKGFFYNTVVAQAQRIEVTDEQVAFAFLPTHRALREQFEQNRAWLESTAERLAGRPVPVVAIQSAGEGPVPEKDSVGVASDSSGREGATRDLKAEALSSTVVQAVLDVFPAEIRDVEEL